MIMISGNYQTELREDIDLHINQIVSNNLFILHEEVKNFQASNISKHIKTYEKIKANSYILDTVKNGIKMVFLKGDEANCVEMTTEMTKCSRLKYMLNFNLPCNFSPYKHVLAVSFRK